MPENKAIGWTVTETIGIGIVNPRGVRRYPTFKYDWGFIYWHILKRHDSFEVKVTLDTSARAKELDMIWNEPYVMKIHISKDGIDWIE